MGGGLTWYLRPTPGGCPKESKAKKSLTPLPSPWPRFSPVTKHRSRIYRGERIRPSHSLLSFKPNSHIPSSPLEPLQPPITLTQARSPEFAELQTAGRERSLRSRFTLRISRQDLNIQISSPSFSARGFISIKAWISIRKSRSIWDWDSLETTVKVDNRPRSN